MYLATDTPYLPGDAYARALVLQWLSIVQSRWNPASAPCATGPSLGKLPRVPRRWSTLKRQAGRARPAICWMVCWPSDPLITGTDHTIADIALFAHHQPRRGSGLRTGQRIRTARWVQRVQESARLPGHQPLPVPTTCTRGANCPDTCVTRHCRCGSAAPTGW